ncbi:MAG: TIGR03960 family B12-binding radical SAM protein [Lachnospiraceae bacterium]|nr:TIGR03960 family B12-binding radical SAM protein [Lachnospiraceae bacterium]
MQDLFLSDEILMQISKPERYIGHEINSVVKRPESVDIRMAMCFPDVYEIGMSHLGIQILYDMFNSYEDVWCERVYSPWPDLDAVMRREHIPLFSLESQEPVKYLDFLAITLQYEMCYTNILQILDLAEIPLRAVDRSDNDPIIVGGGPCSYNPEPIAEFFDFFYIGEGETSYREILDLYKEHKANGGSRIDFLKKVATVPGMYVPQFYDVTYHEDGTIKAYTPNVPEAPAMVPKCIVKNFDEVTYPTKPVVPYIRATQDRVVLEIQRGCIRGCRFCQAGQLYRPVREKNVETLKKYAKEMLENTGYEEITLSSLSSSDYSDLPELVNYLIDICNEKHVNISLPSLRIDSFSLDVMSKVQDIKKSSLTFAPEAGSQRMRNVINKGLTKEDILRGAKMAFEGGWTRVKLYFMLGLPTETEEDMLAIGELANEIAGLFFDTIPKEQRREKIQIVVSTSFFVPKPFTPFQWAPMITEQECIDRAHVTLSGIHSQLNQKRIKYNWHEPDVSVLEGIFARGDRRVAKTILKAYEKGAIFDAWTEYFDRSKWEEAIRETGLDIAFYTSRKRADDEIFPWDHLNCGVSKEFLLREWHRAQEETVSPNCRQSCNGCGAMQYQCGVCVEPHTGEAVHDGSKME